MDEKYLVNVINVLKYQCPNMILPFFVAKMFVYEDGLHIRNAK